MTATIRERPFKNKLPLKMDLRCRLVRSHAPGSRGIDALPFAAATGVLLGVAVLLSAVAALTTARRDIS